MPSDRDAGGAGPGRSPGPLQGERDGPGDWLAPETDDPYDAYAGFDYNDPYDAEAEDDRGLLAQRLLKLGVAVVAVAVFVGVVWYAYSWGTQQAGGSKALPVVRADDGPEKVRPDDPGGMDVPHQDKLVLNENGGKTGDGQVERLLPPPETPQPPPEQPAGQTAATADADGAAGQAADAGEAAAPPSDGANGAAGDSDQVAQMPEAEMPEMPPAPSESEAAAGGTANDATADDAPAGAGPSASDATGGAPEADGGTAANGAAEPSGTADAVGDNGSATTAARLTGGDIAIQLAAFQSESAARRGWKQLQGKHAGLLSDQRLSLQRVEIDGKGTFWRVRTGPFPNRATAEDMCAQLKARGQDCLVVKE